MQVTANMNSMLQAKSSWSGDSSVSSSFAFFTCTSPYCPAHSDGWMNLVVFFHFLVQGFCPKFLSSLREIGQVGEVKKNKNIYILLSCNLNLRTCCHTGGNNQIIHRDKTHFTIIQSNNWTHVLKTQEIPGHRPCKSAPFSEAESIKRAD